MHLLVAVTGPQGPTLADSLRAVLPESNVTYISDFNELLSSAQTVTWDAAIVTPDSLSGSFRAALRLLRPGITIVIAPRAGIDSLQSALQDGADDLIVAEDLSGLVPEILSRLRLRLAARNRQERVLDRYRQVVETPGHISYRLDAEGRFTEIIGNADVLGAPASELLGHHFSEVLDPACLSSVSRDLVLPPLSGVSTGVHGAPGLFDERRRGRRRTNDLKITLRARPGYSHGAEAVVTSAGEVEKRLDGSSVLIGSFGVIHSIRRGGRASEVAHTFYAVAEEAPAAVLVLNSDLIVEYANPSFYYRFAVQPEVILGKSARDLVQYGIDSRVPDEAEKAIAERRRWSGSSPSGAAYLGAAQGRVVIRAITDRAGISRGAVVLFTYISSPLPGSRYRDKGGVYTIEDLVHSISASLEKSGGERFSHLDSTVPRHVGQLPTAGFEFLRATITDLLSAAVAPASAGIARLTVSVDRGKARLVATVTGESGVTAGTGPDPGSPALLAVTEIARDQLSRIGGGVEITRSESELDIAVSFPVGQAAIERAAARLSGGSNQETYSLSAFLSSFQGNASLGDEILTIFAEETPAKLSLLAAAVAAGDHQEARHLAQSLSTTAGTLMHGSAASVARDLEFALRVGDAEASDAAFRRFEPLVNQILSAIRDYRLQGGTENQIPPGLRSGMDSGPRPDSANSPEKKSPQKQ